MQEKFKCEKCGRTAQQTLSPASIWRSAGSRSGTVRETSDRKNLAGSDACRRLEAMLHEQDSTARG